MTLLAKVLSSRVRAGIFEALFGHDREAIHLRELQRRVGLSLGAVRQDIEKLAEMGLVIRRRDGNRLYYRANESHPIFPDICQMVLKTVGLADVLARALRDDDIKSAFIFGSVAQGVEKSESDIDLFIVGAIGLRKVSSLLSGIGNRVGREINPHVLTVEELRQRVESNDHLISSVLASPKLFVIGTEHELGTMVGERLVEAAPH
jgi:DNA-binding transcriptional ArsR family regulator